MLSGGTEKAIGDKEISEALAVLEKYKAAKESLDKRIIVGLSKIATPRLEGLDAESARELRNYLYQMQEQLEYILSNIDVENLSGDLQERLK